MKRRYFLSLLLCSLLCVSPLFSQTLDYEWGHCAANSFIKDSQVLIGLDTGPGTGRVTSTGTNRMLIDSFYRHTMFYFYRDTTLLKTISFYDRAVEILGKAAADTFLKHRNKDIRIDTLLFLDNSLTRIVIKPYLGRGLECSDAITITDTGKGKTIRADNKAAVPGGCAYIFIPCPEQEIKWAQQVQCCDYLSAPMLNKHTKWALTYDFSKQDPVAAWVRRNRFKPGNKGCCSQLDRTAEEPSFHLNLSVQGVDRYIYARHLYDSVLIEAQKSGLTADPALTELDGKAQQIGAKIRGSIVSQKDADYEQAAEDVLELTYKLRALQLVSGKGTSFNRIGIPVMEERGMDLKDNPKGCCSSVYCAKQKARFTPTVDRDLLISVSNFHPYRDSFALSISYSDEFMQDAAVFTKAYASAAKLQAPDTSAARAMAERGVAAGVADDAGSFVTDVKTLDRELAIFYDEKFNQYDLNVHVLEKEVAYIGNNIRIILQVAPNEAAISKKAAEVAAAMAGADKDAFLAAAARAGATLTKIQRYGIFDSKSILVQNKDIINIRFQRFVNGVLKSSDNEATRSYITRGGFKADFSVGMLGSDLIDHKYATIPVLRQDTFFHVDDKGIIHRDQVDSLSAPVQRDSIVRNRQGKYNVLAAVMAHFYYRSGGYLNGALTLGFSINQDADTRYIVGGSLMFMRTARIVLTGGAIMGKVKRLGTGLQEGQVIQLSNYPSSAIPEKDYFKIGCFVGLSWNIAGFNIGSGK